MTKVANPGAPNSTLASISALIGPLEYPKLAPTALKCHRYIAFMGPQSANEVDDAPEFATFVTFRGLRLRKAAEGTPAPGRLKHYSVPKS